MSEEGKWLSAVTRRVVPTQHHGTIGVAIVSGLGLVLFLFHLTNLFDPGGGSLTLLLGTVIPMVLSVLLFVGGLSLARSGYGVLSLRVGLWCLVGVVLLAGICLASVQQLQARGVAVGGLSFLLGVPVTGGAVVGYLIGVYDADRIETERGMAAERERAETLGRRLSVLNRVLRHDIRNDVNVILGNADRIVKGANPEGPAQTIKRKASKLHRVSETAREIESLLGSEEFPTESIDVATLAEAKMQDVQRERPRIEVETSIPGAAWASANPLIESAIENVVENAVEHNDSETPRLSVTVEITARTVAVRIADNGPGVPEDELAVLQRGHETDLDHASGLGLWLANWIVTESGGDVDFEENDPRGSVVTIRLPRTDPPS
ncbi:MAG: sensor histidine kinase [Halobacteriales archaeon]